MIHTRTSDGVQVDAEQYDGTAQSVMRIAKLTGASYTASLAGLMLARGKENQLVPRGRWVCKTLKSCRAPWYVVPENVFDNDYEVDRHAPVFD